MLIPGISVGYSWFIDEPYESLMMFVIYFPMMVLLLYIIVYASERTLTNLEKTRQTSFELFAFALKKTAQKITVHPRKQLVTIKPTLLLAYSKIKTSLYKVKTIDTTKYRDLLDTIFRMDQVD